VALAGGAWWLLRSERTRGVSGPQPPAAPQAAPVSTTDQKSALPAAATNVAVQPTPPGTAPKGQPPTALPVLKGAVDPAKKAAAAAALEDLKKQYGYAGALSWDDAKALIAQRQQETKALEDRLAALGPGGARAITAAYNETDDMRGKLLLIHALGGIQDGEAAAALQELLTGESSYSLQREIVVALGQRQDAASVELLMGILAGSADPQVRFAAAQALSGKGQALSLLADRVGVETSLDVRMELIRAIGAIGNDAARSALVRIAQGPLDANVRQAAIQELGRKFGAGALGVLDTLLRDPDERIRRNAVTAVARVGNEQAKTLLQRTATSDASEAVREAAKAALAAGH
jgi:HEAT repeat protein